MSKVCIVLGDHMPGKDAFIEEFLTPAARLDLFAQMCGSGVEILKNAVMNEPLPEPFVISADCAEGLGEELRNLLESYGYSVDVVTFHNKKPS